MPLNVKTVTITPATARKLLETQDQNRNVSRRRVEQVAEDMASIRWVPNGESIKVDTKNRLLDGQHRLMACIKAGKSFETLLVSGLDPKVVESIDQGASRSPSNVLQMLKPPVKQATTTAAMVRLLWQFEKFGQPAFGGGNKINTAPTRAQLVSKYRELRGLDESIAMAWRLRKSMGFMSVVSISTCHWLFKTKAGLTKADAFFEELETGGGGRGSATFTLLNRLRTNRPTRREAPMAFTIKAWNAWLKGSKLGVIKYSAFEPFPDIEGGKK